MGSRPALTLAEGFTGGGEAAHGETRSEGGSVLVTPPVCLTGETRYKVFSHGETAKVVELVDGRASERTASVPFFVDWLSLSQEHPGPLPVVDAGCVMSVTDAGVIEWKTSRAVKHEGSFETSINVRCDGHRVTLSGNLSRFGRSDNLFGLSLWDCLERANQVLAVYGLPPFTAGERLGYIKRGQVRYGWTGARISRIDLTANYEAGSAQGAHAVMQFLGEQHAGRKTGRVLGQGETVDFGAGSRRQYWKAYIKHLELIRHGCADQRLIDHCQARGLVRWEGTLRSNALTEMGAAYLGDYFSGWAMGQLVRLFDEQTAVLGRVTQSVDELELLPRHLRATARDYLAGADLAASLSRATFYRHRSALLPFGLDIAVRNVRPFTPRVQVVQLVRAEVPSWYQLAA